MVRADSTTPPVVVAEFANTNAGRKAIYFSLFQGLSLFHSLYLLLLVFGAYELVADLISFSKLINAVPGVGWIFFMFVMALLGYVVLHEVVHHIVARLNGFDKVNIAGFKKLKPACYVPDTFQALPKYLAGALAPAFVFGLVLISVAIAIHANPIAISLLQIAVFCHIGCCIGDFALLSVMWSFKARAPMAYDDSKTGTMKIFASPISQAIQN